LGSIPIKRIQGFAKSMGEYHRNPTAMVATAHASTAKKLIPANE